ncbi:hypothetical protein [Methylovorus glucosotrophus]|uniref:hypothetical protein n=1 Tax=Methylovorus glucosotrophus TaxID=266009 RepID=UPI00059EBF9F|nr:hypothetical protein [Methylovorus glucosotrophus]
MDWFCWVWEKQCNIEGSAAWFQAVMSVGAIVYASWISRASERRASKNNVQLIVVLLINLKRDLDGLQKACAEENISAYNLILTSLANEIDSFQEIDMSQFNFGVVKALRNIKTEASLILNMESFIFPYAAPFSEYKQKIFEATKTITETSDFVVKNIVTKINFDL